MNPRGQNRPTPALAERLADLLKAQSDPELRMLGDALAEWLAADAPTEALEVALGVAHAPGTNWRRERARGRRNGHVLAAAEASGETPRQLAARWRRYASTGWPRHRNLDEVPSSLIGKPEAHLWFAMKADPAHDPVALSDRQIARLVKANAGGNAGLFATKADSDIMRNE